METSSGMPTRRTLILNPTIFGKQMGVIVDEHKCEWACRANGLQTSQEGAVRGPEVSGAKHQEM